MQAEAWSQVVRSYCNHHSAVFPGCLGDTQFCFRFRQGSNRKSSLGCFLETTDRDAPPCLKVRRHTQHQRPTYINVHYSKHVNHLVKTLFWLCVCVLQREQGHYYGYVYFRQVRDKSLKRGYFQKVSDRLPFSFNAPKTCQEPSMKNKTRLINQSVSLSFGQLWTLSNEMC